VIQATDDKMMQAHWMLDN